MSAGVGVGVVGLGFMGRTHVRAYKSAFEAGAAGRLVAVCDGDAARLDGRDVSAGNIEAGAGDARLFDPSAVRGYARAEELLADPDVALVSICTPTDTHAELAIAALRAGKHVLLEKPAARTAGEVERIVAAAREAPGRLCVPAHCMRFWPGWSWLRERVRDGRYGRVRSAVFRRLATPPGWSRDFYGDEARTGGALVDLHVHDADFVRWCFGTPDAVVSGGSTSHLTTIYRYAGGPRHVVAEGGWDHAPGWTFQMGFVVVFEQATASYDFGRGEKLLLHRGGESEPVPIEAATGYEVEVRAVLDAVARGRAVETVTIEDALATARLLEAEHESLLSGRPVAPK